VANVVKVGDTVDGTAATANSYTMVKGYTLTYDTADAQGNKGEQVNQVIYPGKYLAVVTAVEGPYAGGEIALPFTVTPATFNNLTVYEVDPENATNYADEDFV
ncbi:hypothetical protein PZH32_12570, partial [Adlercreutzia equolifaciens]|uniref:hypothetical protein n=1 Tax=Adlercreutzia equolifaciens TaxID=446660 RepID=UPI0023AF4F97